MHIEFGYWLIPFMITIVGTFFIKDRTYKQRSYIDCDIGSFFGFIGWLIISLISWLIWALLK